MKYEFASQTIVICFWSQEHEWSLVSLSGCYDFTKTELKEMEFREITEVDFRYNMQGTIDRGAKYKVFTVDISKLDRHVLMQKFTFKLSFMYIEDLQMQLFSPVYTAMIPYFQKVTKLKFKSLGYFQPDRRIVSLYNANFKLDDPSLDTREKELLLELQ